MKFSNIWKETGATVTAIGIVAVAVAPLFRGGMPTSSAEWIAFLAAMAAAAVKALGK
jgi:hypothetical protein